MCVKLCVGVGVNHFKGRRWSPLWASLWWLEHMKWYDCSIRSRDVSQEQPQTFSMMVGLICRTCAPTPTPTPQPQGWGTDSPPTPNPPPPTKKNTHMFTSQPLFCGLTSERVLLGTTRRMNLIDVYLVFKALISARLHSLSSLRISGPHWEVSLMTHKHISMTFMWNRAYQVCVCAPERQTLKFNCF